MLGVLLTKGVIDGLKSTIEFVRAEKVVDRVGFAAAVFFRNLSAVDLHTQGRDHVQGEPREPSSRPIVQVDGVTILREDALPRHRHESAQELHRSKVGQEVIVVAIVKRRHLGIRLVTMGGGSRLVPIQLGHRGKAVGVGGERINVHVGEVRGGYRTMLGILLTNTIWLGDGQGESWTRGERKKTVPSRRGVGTRYAGCETGRESFR